MHTATQLIEARGAVRYPVQHAVVAEHGRLGELALTLVNISATGFMTQFAANDTAPVMSRGDRLSIRLPVIGRIEAHMVWTSGGRSGFQFERMLRPDDLADLIAAL